MPTYIASIPAALPIPSSPDDLYTVRITWDGIVYEDVPHYAQNSQWYWFIGDHTFENFPFFMRLGFSVMKTNVGGYHDIKIEIIYPNDTMDAKYIPQIYVVYYQDGSIVESYKTDLASALNELAGAAASGTASDISFSWTDPQNT